MKKSVVFITLLAFTLSCTKKEVAPAVVLTTDNVIIYADKPGKPITVLVDGLQYGNLTFYSATKTVDCSNPGPVSPGLNQGTHTLVAYDLATAKRWEQTFVVGQGHSFCLQIQLAR